MFRTAQTYAGRMDAPSHAAAAQPYACSQCDKFHNVTGGCECHNTCDGCFFTFASLSDFRDHMNRRYSDNACPPTDSILVKKTVKGESMPCPFCGRIFTGDHYVRNFNRHVAAARAHGRCHINRVYDKVLRCLFCPKKFEGEPHTFPSAPMHQLTVSGQHRWSNRTPPQVRLPEGQRFLQGVQAAHQEEPLSLRP